MKAEWTGRNRVDLTLTHDDAIVLSDLLHRWREGGTLGQLPFEDDAEAILLTDLMGAVESVVDETTDENYLPAVREARVRVRSRVEPLGGDRSRV